MSTFTFGFGAITSGTGTADNASLNGTGYAAILGGTTTQAVFVEEVYLGGQAASTAPHIMMLRRSSTIAGTPTALSANSGNSFGLNNASGGVLTSTPTAFIASTTGPTPSGTTTLGRKVFSYNAFGGIVRANYANTQDRFGIIGNTASMGEMSLSAFTGTTSAAFGGHIIVEVS